MKKENIKSKKGFTIIEVVLVLAIAGLIFLMVFVALPALQRNQRDTQRREDASRLVSQVNAYKTDHNGSMPANAAAITSYLGTFNDPGSSTAYTVTVNKITANPTIANTFTVGNMAIYYPATCNTSNKPVYSAGKGFVVYTKLEGGGTDIDYCIGG